MHPSTTDIGALFVGKAVGAGTATAAGTGDATKVTGQSIDVMTYKSGSLFIAGKAALAEDKTLTYAVEYQLSDDNTNWDTAVAIQAATLAATGDTGGTTEYPVVKLDVDLVAYGKRYVRFNITPDLSASGTDTLTWAAVFVAGGGQNLPAT